MNSKYYRIDNVQRGFEEDCKSLLINFLKKIVYNSNILIKNYKSW